MAWGLTLLAVSGCSSDGDPALLGGVERIEMIEPSVAVASVGNAWNGEPTVVAVEGAPPAVVLLFLGGPACRSDYQSQQPGAVYVEYAEDLIVIEIDNAGRGSSRIRHSRVVHIP